MKMHWITAGILLLLCAGCLLIPSDQESGNRIGNRRPAVEITAGAASADSAGIDYKVDFRWRGADDDGVVTQFQYAIDDTTTESAWQDTTAYSVVVKVQSTHLPLVDPLDNTDVWLRDWHTFYVRAVDNEYATSLVDKRYFCSRTIAPKTTITFPKALAGVAGNYRRTLIIEWTGEDLDSSAPDKSPIYYEIKLIRTATFSADSTVQRQLRVDNNTFLDSVSSGDHKRWLRIPGTVHQKILFLAPTNPNGQESYVFAIRAIDEAGAVEPFLEETKNWVKFTVNTEQSRPRVTITERFLGQHTFIGDTWGTPTNPLEVPAGTELRFKWTGNADSYGSKPGNSNYALAMRSDFDPADERFRDANGINGWIGWALWEGTSQPIIFSPEDDGAIHIFYLRMRDITDAPGSEALCAVVMRVVAFRFNHTALLVDDARLSSYTGLTNRNQDQIHDAFIARFTGRMLDLAPDAPPGGLEQVSLYMPATNAPEGRSPTAATALKASKMAQYQALLWSYNYGGTSGNPGGLAFHEFDYQNNNEIPQKHLLASFVAAGGKLFLFGGRPLSALVNLGGNSGPDFPKLPPQVAEQSGRLRFTDTNFVWKFLHVRNQIVGVDALNCAGTPPNEHQQFRDGLMRCVSTNPAYPDLYLDLAKWNPDDTTRCNQPGFRTPDGGILDWEGVIDGDPRDPDGGYSAHVPDPGLDTLYTAVCTSWVGGTMSTWDGAVIAQRYESTHADTIRGTQQGRVIMFTFQPYPFMEGPAINAGTAAINWLMTGSDR
jgi:hypothetical protein